MPTSLPPSVRETLGETAAGDFAAWLDETFQQRTVHRDEYREVLSRLDVLEERFDQLEARLDDRFEQIDRRFEQIDRRFESMEQRFDQRLDKMNERFDRLNEAMRVQTRWTVGTIALFGTIVTVLLAIAQFGG